MVIAITYVTIRHLIIYNFDLPDTENILPCGRNINLKRIKFIQLK